MATKVKWTHVWNKVTGKYFGFFLNAKDANAWLKKQAPGTYEINDKRPARDVETTTKTKTTTTVDAALTAALTAAKAEEAKHDDGQQGADGQGGAEEAPGDRGERP